MKRRKPRSLGHTLWVWNHTLRIRKRTGTKWQEKMVYHQDNNTAKKVKKDNNMLVGMLSQFVSMKISPKNWMRRFCAIKLRDGRSMEVTQHQGSPLPHLMEIWPSPTKTKQIRRYKYQIPVQRKVERESLVPMLPLHHLISFRNISSQHFPTHRLHSHHQILRNSNHIQVQTRQCHLHPLRQPHLTIAS